MKENVATVVSNLLTIPRWFGMGLVPFLKFAQREETSRHRALYTSYLLLIGFLYVQAMTWPLVIAWEVDWFEYNPATATPIEKMIREMPEPQANMISAVAKELLEPEVHPGIRILVVLVMAVIGGISLLCASFLWAVITWLFRRRGPDVRFRDIWGHGRLGISSFLVPQVVILLVALIVSYLVFDNGQERVRSILAFSVIASATLLLVWSAANSATMCRGFIVEAKSKYTDLFWRLLVGGIAFWPTVWLSGVILFFGIGFLPKDWAVVAPIIVFYHLAVKLAGGVNDAGLL